MLLLLKFPIHRRHYSLIWTQRVQTLNETRSQFKSPVYDAPPIFLPYEPYDRAAVDTVGQEGLDPPHVTVFSGTEFEFQTNFIVNADDGIDWWLHGDTRRGSLGPMGYIGKKKHAEGHTTGLLLFISECVSSNKSSTRMRQGRVFFSEGGME